MSKIEIITQPETKDRVKQTPDKKTLEKLRELVLENPGSTLLQDAMEPDKKPNDKSPSVQTSDAASNKKDKSLSISTDDRTKGEKVESPKEYDQDGFEIPQGKIPLDGHFSSNEIKELVNLAILEGLLKPTVEVKVLEHNDLVGDKVVIMEREEPEPSSQTEPQKAPSEENSSSEESDDNK